MDRHKRTKEALASRKYQFMEANMQRRGAGLKEKIPDIQKTLDMVRFLKTRKVSFLQRYPLRVLYITKTLYRLARLRSHRSNLRIE